MTDFEGQVLQDLSVLKMQMQQLMGIGQPGRLNQLESRVASHERSVQRLKGLGAAFGTLLTLAQLAIAWVRQQAVDDGCILSCEKEGQMSEDDFKMLMAEFERQLRECDTPEKAIAQLQKEALLDANGKLPARYGGEGADVDWQ